MCITTATLSADERDDRWRDYTLRMLDTLSRAGVRHYIKKDLQRFPSAWLSISAGSFSGTSPPCSNSFPTNRRSTRALIAHLKLEIQSFAGRFTAATRSAKHRCWSGWNLMVCWCAIRSGRLRSKESSAKGAKEPAKGAASMCPRVAIIATPKRKMPSGSGTVVLGGRTRRGSGPQRRIGKIPSSGMRKLARLNESTAIDRVCSVRRLPMCSIIRLPQSGAKTCLH